MLPQMASPLKQPRPVIQQRREVVSATSASRSHDPSNLTMQAGALTPHPILTEGISTPHLCFHAVQTVELGFSEQIEYYVNQSIYLWLDSLHPLIVSP